MLSSPPKAEINLGKYLQKDKKTDSRYYEPIEKAFRSIGYSESLIAHDYEFSNFSSESARVGRIGLGVFAQEPFSYRSACFGVHVLPQGTTGKELVRKLRPLGATQFFIIVNGTSEWWINGAKEAKLKDTVPTQKIPAIIRSNRQDWNPDEMIRLKSGFPKPSGRQIDFVDIGLLPALEHEASEKMDQLIKRVAQIGDERKKAGYVVDDRSIFNITFRLLTAKLLKDRNVATRPEIDFSNPLQTLKAVSGFYRNKFGENLSTRTYGILRDISAQIAGSFSFRNLSVETLAYVYENTLVTRETRKKLGIHSTPSYIADYVLAQMPIEEIPRSKWKAFDPMCGHGIFLTAAMRRMRTLLPKDWGGRKRHEFFTKALVGTEIDTFSEEIARMCLTLADFPESNGWDIRQADIFQGKLLEKLAPQATMLVGNPPFETEAVGGKNLPKPALLLNRALRVLREGSLVGIVLPRAFLDSIDYRREREYMLKNFGVICVTGLPDKVFRYADSETAIVVAQKHKKSKGGMTVYREVRDQERDTFRLSHMPTWEDNVPTPFFLEKMNGIMAVPLLRDVWEVTGRNSALRDVSRIAKGVEYEPSKVAGIRTRIIKDKPFENSAPAIMKASDGFEQFVATNTSFISVDVSLHRRRARGAWNLPWGEAKVIVPASRISRGPWRSAAAIDRAGRYVSRDFYAIWPKPVGISVETIAAIINSPLAQAYIFAHSSQRGTPKRVYEQVPIPDDIFGHDDVIKSLVNMYVGNQGGDPDELRELLLQIDAEILKLYNLPPKLEREVLDLFWGKQRPVPFKFDRYIPPEMKSWVPLHIYISKKYREATPSAIMKRLPIIDDPKLLEYLETISS